MSEEIGICSDCGQQKKIGLAHQRGTGIDGQVHIPCLRCEDCVQLQLDEDIKNETDKKYEYSRQYPNPFW